MQKVKFNQTLCNVRLSSYMTNDQAAILLVDAHTGERVATASICNTQNDLLEGRTWIKDYGSNEGIAKALEDAGVIRLTGLSVKTGFTEILEAEILIKEEAE